MGNLFGGGGGAKQSVARYHLSMHFGICHGPGNVITELWIGEKLVWSGRTSVGGMDLSKEDLFGGIRAEGGVSGRLFVLDGSPSQVLPEELANKMGGTAATLPGFRGFLSAFFTGGVGVSPVRSGWYWGANSPYLKSPWFRVERFPSSFYPEKAAIGPDANPAHIIYECMMNADWGMGGSEAEVDLPALRAAADTLYNEGFGLSLAWTGQTTVKAFIQEILDHIEANFYLSPRTGLLTLKLTRGDYNLETLRVIDPTNAVMTNFERKAWGETVNELNVTWTNPENEQEETITVHDLGNIAAQQGVVSGSRNYYGIRNANLAARVATRDLSVAAFPLASCNVEVDRTLWDLVPGEVVKVNWPEHSLQDIPMRVGEISYGEANDPALKVNLIEDIFAITTTPYIDPPSTGWEDPSALPTVMFFTRVMTAPYFFVARLYGDPAAEAMEYPQAYDVVLGSQNNRDTRGYELLAEGVDVSGNQAFRSAGVFILAGRATTSAAMAQEAESILAPVLNFFGNVGPDVGAIVRLGAEDSTAEWAVVQSVTADGPILYRGILDTVPRAWPSGTPIWFFPVSRTVFDSAARASGQLVRYKYLSQTSKGTLAETAAPVVEYTVTDRQHLPLRPANVKVNGVLFGPTSVVAGANLAFTWSNRNRLVETSQALRWDASSVAPEDGQTTTIILKNSDGSVFYTATGLTGTAYTVVYDDADVTGPTISYEVRAARDGLLSLQAATKVLIAT